jgi:hypothetical protein
MVERNDPFLPRLWTRLKAAWLVWKASGYSQVGEPCWRNAEFIVSLRRDGVLELTETRGLERGRDLHAWRNQGWHYIEETRRQRPPRYSICRVAVKAKH